MSLIYHSYANIYNSFTNMTELEKTYLAKYLPEDLDKFPAKEIIDMYIPKTSSHPKLRIRKCGEKYEITKKEPLNETDYSTQQEQTIKLTKEEFEELSKLPSRRTRKIRYYYEYRGETAEIDVFQEDLTSLVLVDFEFSSSEEKENFKMPDFCLAEVTQENFIAGGELSGKSYENIKKDLSHFGYRKITR